jgi:hypothetical protein
VSASLKKPIAQNIHPWSQPERSTKNKGQRKGRVFYSRRGRASIYHAVTVITKQPNLKLKAWPEQLLVYEKQFKLSNYQQLINQLKTE